MTHTRTTSSTTYGRITSAVVFLVTGFVALILVLFFIRETSMIIAWSSSGFVLSSIENQNQPPIRFWQVDAEDFPNGPRPIASDTLLTMDGDSASLNLWIDLLERPHPPGKQVQMTYISAGDTLHTVIQSRPVQRSDFIAVVLAQFLKGLLILSFVGVGLWALPQRKNSPAVRMFSLYALSMAGFMGLTYMPMFPEMGSFQVPGYDLLRTLLTTFSAGFGGFWLAFNLRFPRPHGKLGRRPALALLVAMSPLLVVIILQYAIPGGLGVFLAPALGIVWCNQIGWGLYLLAHHRKHAKSMLERRQTSLVLWGSGVGLILLLAHQMTVPSVFTNLLRLAPLVRMMITNGVFLVLLLSPVTAVFALGRYRLLEVEARLRRGIRNALITVGLIAAYAGIIVVVWIFILDEFGIDGRTPSLVVALGLALGIAPLHVRIRRIVDRITFPERQRLASMVESLPAWSGTLPGPSAMCDRFVRELRDNLGVSSLACYLYDEENSPGHLAARANGTPQPDSSHSSEVSETVPGDHFMQLFSTRNHPVFVDELRARRTKVLDEQDWRWLKQSGIVMLLPLQGSSRVIGFLASGRKQNHDDFHHEEVHLLGQLADRAGLALENQRLLQDNLDKQRMEHDLLFARDVQMRLLPLDLPKVEGLDVAARVSFSTEMAGDYYDVLTLPDGRTAFAVADVSGKGAGAALLMANLQASFRAFSSIGLELARMTAEINRMIHANTSAEAYITFFACVYDPRGRVLTYVDAGHNPPMFHRPGEPLRMLDEGGLVLGVLPDAVYEERTLQLQPGDRLLIYTDGLSEASNGEDEEYGDKRVAEFFQSQPSASADQTLDELLADVHRFSGGGSMDDDTTALLIQVT